MDQDGIPLTDREFERVKQRVYRVAGISLSEAKRTLVISRLHKLVKTLGLTSFDAYLDHLERPGADKDAQDFVNALTTNLTRFFREDHHFEHLCRHVGSLMTRRPRLNADGRPRLRIWSAGCSTGQEPYTIAVALLDALPELRRWDFRILATDIDTSVITRAAQGIYPAAELAELSPERQALFERGADGNVRIPAAARAVVAFKPLNLMEDWPMSGPFDAIFCRNVAIYFDKATQRELFGRFHAMLAADGFLYIGHAETLGGSAIDFRLAGKTIYQPRAAQGTRSAA